MVPPARCNTERRHVDYMHWSCPSIRQFQGGNTVETVTMDIIRSFKIPMHFQYCAK